MEFGLTALRRLTGATVVRWPAGAPHQVVPINDWDRARPGALFFPRFPAGVGHRLFRWLARKGAAGLVLCAGQAGPDPVEFPHLGVLSLDSPSAGFRQLAADARSRIRGFVAGITGTSGKSATTEYLAACLAGRGPVFQTRYSCNVIHDTAAVLLDLGGGPDEAAVIEMGFGQEGDIQAMAALARPQAAIVTNVTPAHLEGAAGSWERVALAKGQLPLAVPPAGLVALHSQDPGCDLIRQLPVRARLLSFGPDLAADARYECVRVSEGGTLFTLSLFGDALTIRLQAVGEVQAANAAAAALVARMAGASLPDITEGLAAVEPLPRRFNLHCYSEGLTVIDDSFSASVDATRHGLSTAAALARGRPLIAVLSGIAYLGERSLVQHRALGAHAVACGCSDLVLVADGVLAGLREGALGAGLPPDRIHLVPDKEGLPERLLALAGPERLLYCKARQGHWIGPLIDQFRSALLQRGFEPVARPESTGESPPGGVTS